MAQLPDEVKELINRPNFAHVATLMADGSPHVDPVWMALEGEHILIATGEGTLKAKNTRRDARVALSIVDFEDPYWVAQIRGRVVERRPDEHFVGMDPIAHKYTGAPFPWREPKGRVVFVIEAEHVRHARLPFKHEPA